MRGKVKRAGRPAKVTCTLGTPTRAWPLPVSAPLKRSQRPPKRRKSTAPTAKGAHHRALLPAPSAGKAKPHSLPKMANTQPVSQKGCSSQRPNVLRAFRSVPFARRQRDAHSTSLPADSTHWRRRTPRPQRLRVLLATLSPPHSPQPFRPGLCAGGFILRLRAFRAGIFELCGSVFATFFCPFTFKRLSGCRSFHLNESQYSSHFKKMWIHDDTLFRC